MRRCDLGRCPASSCYGHRLCSCVTAANASVLLKLRNRNHRQRPARLRLHQRGDKPTRLVNQVVGCFRRSRYVDFSTLADLIGIGQQRTAGPMPIKPLQSNDRRPVACSGPYRLYLETKVRLGIEAEPWAKYRRRSLETRLQT